MDKYHVVLDYLWSMRGRLKCTYCNGPVISGNYRDELGYRYTFECIKCNKPQNNYTLAKHNGYEERTK